MTNADMCCNNGVVQKYISTKNVQQIPDTINTTFSVCSGGGERGGMGTGPFPILAACGKKLCSILADLTWTPVPFP